MKVSEQLQLLPCLPAGCVVGNTMGARIASSPWNAGAWSGKCFNKWNTNSNLPVGVSNIITAGKDGMVSVAGSLGGFCFESRGP